MRITLNIVASLLVLAGVIWFLQGINVLPGSFMTGQTRWTVYGGIAIALGIALLLRAIETDRRRLALPATELTQQRLPVLNDPLKAAGPHPALHLLIGRSPGREIVWHEAPLVATLNHIADRVENRPQIMLSTRVVRTAQPQIRQHKRPLLIRYVRQISRATNLAHPSMLVVKPRPAKNLARFKCHNSLYLTFQQSAPVALFAITPKHTVCGQETRNLELRVRSVPTVVAPKAGYSQVRTCLASACDLGFRESAAQKPFKARCCVNAHYG
jgi:hypothetical protein